MDKLELNLDDLQVDSFSTGSEEKVQKGTVKGNLPYTWQEYLDVCVTDANDCSEPVYCSKVCEIDY